MSMQIVETFEVQAPPARVWAYLIDPRQVVQCLPGAELSDVEDERTFQGRIRIRVGPVTATYKGTARLEEVNEAEHHVRLAGEGRDTAGSGSARMTMSSRLASLPGGGTQVRIEATVDVVGRIVQFGRGLMEEVSRQLFREFSACVQATLAEQGARAQGADAAEPPTPEPLPPPPGAAVPEVGAAAAETPPPPTAPQRPSATTQPLRALPLLFRAFSALVRRSLARLLRR